jgi:hypothetical protein
MHFPRSFISRLPVCELFYEKIYPQTNPAVPSCAHRIAAASPPLTLHDSRYLPFSKYHSDRSSTQSKNQQTIPRELSQPERLRLSQNILRSPVSFVQSLNILFPNHTTYPRAQRNSYINISLTTRTQVGTTETFVPQTKLWAAEVYIHVCNIISLSNDYSAYG